MAETHQVEIVTIDKDKFIDLVSRFCPNAISKFIKRQNSSDDTPKVRVKTKYHFRPLGWSEHLSLTDVLSHIYVECGRNNIDLSKLREDHQYWSILHEIEGLISRDWNYSLKSIIDPTLWHVDRLLRNPAEWQPDFLMDVKRIRKPTIEVTTFVTARDNLSIVWHPQRADFTERGIYKVGDWARWPGEDTYGWSRPHNELVFIREIDRHRPGEVRYRNDPETCNLGCVGRAFRRLD